MRLIVATIAVLAAGAATADTKLVLHYAKQIGRVAAAEKFCSLTYDRSELRAFLSRNVPDDPRFWDWLEQYQNEALRLQAQMKPGEKAAYCGGAIKDAKKMKLIS